MPEKGVRHAPPGRRARRRAGPARMTSARGRRALAGGGRRVRAGGVHRRRHQHRRQARSRGGPAARQIAGARRARHARRPPDRRHRRRARRSAAHGADVAVRVAGRVRRSTTWAPRSASTARRSTPTATTPTRSRSPATASRSRRCGRCRRCPTPGMQPRAARNLHGQRALPAARRVRRRRGLCGRRAVGRGRLSAALAARAGAPAGTPIEGRRRRRPGCSPRSGRPTCSPTGAELPDFFKLLVAAPLGVALALAFQLADIWPPPRSLLVPLLAAPSIVAAAFALRKVMSRKASGTRSAKT